MCPNTSNPYLVSADPGSSAKGWAVASCEVAHENPITIRRFESPELYGLIVELCQEAKKRPVLVAIDAPIRVFGGVQAPLSLAPYEDWPETQVWPFDVNPFSQRPCESALSRIPPPSRDNQPDPHGLASAIDSLNGNPSRGNSKKERQSFVTKHAGVSVLGYMGAPHAPIVRTFLAELKVAAVANSVEVSYDAAAEWEVPGVITVLECHPAVAMAFYCVYGARGLGGFPECVSKYKGAKKQKESLTALESMVTSLLRDKSWTYPDDTTKLAADDQLDALVGLLNLLDFANGTGDLFGTAEEGYFLIPGGGIPGRFRKLWRDAREESRKQGGGAKVAEKPV